MTQFRLLIFVSAMASMGLSFGELAALAGTVGSPGHSGKPANGEVLYQEHCASCHGAQLEGQPEWRSPGSDGILPAPPHDETGHTWHHPDSMLFEYTKLGGQKALAKMGVEFESGMPEFGDQLSDEDIVDILAFIKSTWPARIQEIQKQRTEFDEQNPNQ